MWVVHVSAMLQEATRGHWSLWSSVTGGYKQPDVGAKN